MKLLGIDYGAQKVGIAIADTVSNVTFPKSVISNTDMLVKELAEMAVRESVDAFVIGDTRSLSGETQTNEKAVKKIGDALRRVTDLPVHFAPEHFTTKEALRAQEEAGTALGRVDANAAALILEWFMSTNPS